MDTITHALSGALLGRATAPRQPGPQDLSVRARVLVAGAAAAFPDADSILALASPVLYLTTHRGVTHSLLLAPLWALLIGWLAAKVARDPRGLRPFFFPALLGLGIHILGDWITSFGTMLLAPLSDRRFALSTTFIIDLWLTGIIVAGLLASLVFRRTRAPAEAALVALVGYVGLQGFAHFEALNIGRQLAAARGLPLASTVTVWPRPVSPFNWTVVADAGDRYHVTHINLLRREPLPGSEHDGFIRKLDAAYLPVSQAQWQTYTKFGEDAKAAAFAKAAWRTPEFAFYRWFAALPAVYRIDPAGQEPLEVQGGATAQAVARGGSPAAADESIPACAWFFDLRFLTPGRDAVPFRYGLCAEDGRPLAPFVLDGPDSRVRLN